MLCEVLNISCVQEIPDNFKKLQIESLETRRKQVTQLTQIAEYINQQISSIQEDSSTEESPDQIDRVCNYTCHTSFVCMYITLRKQLILQVVIYNNQAVRFLKL